MIPQQGSGCLTVMCALAAAGLLFFFADQSDKQSSIVRERYSALARKWTTYSDKHCVKTSKLYGAVVGAGKFSASFDGNEVKCPDGLTYFVSDQILNCAQSQRSCYGLNEERIPAVPKS